MDRAGIRNKNRRKKMVANKAKPRPTMEDKMQDKEKYLKELESKIEKYKNKIKDMEIAMEGYKSKSKDNLMTESNNIKSQFKEAEEIFQKLKSSTEDEYEEIKESSAEIFEALKDAFNELSTSISFGNLSKEIKELSNEKIVEIEDYIKEKPLTCASWAFGIGLVTGILIRRVS